MGGLLNLWDLRSQSILYPLSCSRYSMKCKCFLVSRRPKLQTIGPSLQICIIKGRDRLNMVIELREKLQVLFDINEICNKIYLRSFKNCTL